MRRKNTWRGGDSGPDGSGEAQETVNRFAVLATPLPELSIEHQVMHQAGLLSRMRQTDLVDEMTPKQQTEERVITETVFNNLGEVRKDNQEKRAADTSPADLMDTETPKNARRATSSPGRTG